MPSPSPTPPESIMIPAVSARLQTQHAVESSVPPAPPSRPGERGEEQEDQDVVLKKDLSWRVKQRRRGFRRRLFDKLLPVMHPCPRQSERALNEDFGIAAFLLEIMEMGRPPPRRLHGSHAGPALHLHQRPGSEIPIRHARPEDLQQYERFSMEVPDDSFVEIGCGNGLLTWLLSECGLAGRGFDRDPRWVWSDLEKLRSTSSSSSVTSSVTTTSSASMTASPAPILVQQELPLLDPDEAFGNLSFESFDRDVAEGLVSVGTSKPCDDGGGRAVPVCVPCDDPSDSDCSLPPLSESESDGSLQGMHDKNQKNVWLLANHTDQLTPYVPQLAAHFGANCVFVLPCCAFDFRGLRYVRRDSKVSQWRCYLTYIESLLAAAGFRTERYQLPICSSKNVAIVGRRREAEVGKLSG